MKRLLGLFLALMLVLPLASGCKKKEGDGGGADDGHYKIGVVTGSAIYNEAIFAAERMAQTYNYVVTRVYADNLSAESTVSVCTELASDPNMRVIVFVRSIAGIDTAISKVKESRPDILFIVGANTEDGEFVSRVADVCLAQDIFNMGTAIINQAYRMGAKKFIHYTFARHLLNYPIIKRRELMVRRCAELGIEFIDITTPDPEVAEGGGAEARQFIIEDVSEKVGDFGANTAFFSTDCTVHEQLIKSVLENGAIYPQQCCPNPFHGYATLFGIDMGQYDDPQGVLNQISAKVAEYGNTSRMSTWAISSDVLMVCAGVRYAIEYCEGRANGAVDMPVWESLFDGLTERRCTLRQHGNAQNYLLFLCDYYTL